MQNYPAGREIIGVRAFEWHFHEKWGSVNALIVASEPYVGNF